ncbi:MAG: AMP-binding protein, partial [Actinomycetota bacterium]
MRKGLGSMTVGEMLRGRATATPNRVAIDFLDRPTTYRELDTRSERLAAALLRAGLRQGDRVATITGTCPEHVEIFFACAKAGLILVPLNWRLAPAELAYQLRDSDAGILFVQPAYESLADEVAKQTSVTPLRVTLEAGALAGFVEGAGDARSVSVADDDPLLIIYTA